MNEHEEFCKAADERATKAEAERDAAILQLSVIQNYVNEEGVSDTAKVIRVQGVVNKPLKRICQCGLPITEALHICRPPMKMPDKQEEWPTKSCNRHTNCADASQKYKEENGREPGVNFHCWSEDCEDCFGK
jgi:hypothetical protein